MSINLERALASKIKEYVASLERNGMAVVIIVADMKNRAGDLKIVGLNSHKEALPLLEMAKSLCETGDDNVHQQMVLKPKSEESN